MKSTTSTPQGSHSAAKPNARVQGVGDGEDSQTRPVLSEGSAPRLPHERDESSDSQTNGVRPVIKQAHDDLAAGQLDTSREAATQQAYERQKDGPRGQPETSYAEPGADAKTDDKSNKRKGTET